MGEGVWFDEVFGNEGRPQSINWRMLGRSKWLFVRVLQHSKYIGRLQVYWATADVFHCSEDQLIGSSHRFAGRTWGTTVYLQ